MQHSPQLHRIERKLDLLLHLNNLELKDDRKIMADLTEITANVAKIDTAEASAVQLLGDLKTRLDAAGTDPVALKALSDDLGSHADQLAAAVVANTPSA